MKIGRIISGFVSDSIEHQILRNIWDFVKISVDVSTETNAAINIWVATENRIPIWR